MSDEWRLFRITISLFLYARKLYWRAKFTTSFPVNKLFVYITMCEQNNECFALKMFCMALEENGTSDYKSVSL